MTTPYAFLELSKKLQAIGCVMENDCHLFCPTEDEDIVKVIPTFSPLDFIGCSETARESCNTLVSCGAPDCSKNHGYKFRRNLLDQPDWPSFWRVVEEALEER